MGLKGNLPNALAAVLSTHGIGTVDDPTAERLVAEMLKLAGTDPCFVKARPDEPLFVLRAQDQLAPNTVQYWLSEFEDTPKFMEGNEDALRKRNDAVQLLMRMEHYQAAHGSKVPD